MISRLRIGTTDDALLVVEIVDLNGDPFTGLSPTATVTAPSGAVLALPASGLMAAVTGIGGLYKLTAGAALFTETGTHAVVYNPNSALAAPLAAGAVDRVAGLAHAGFNTGRMTLALSDDLDLWVWISDLAGVGLAGLTPTLTLVAPNLAAVVLPSSTLAAVAAAPGAYRLGVSKTVLTQTGGYYGRVDPNDAAAARVPAFVIMRGDTLETAADPATNPYEGVLENLRATVAGVTGMKSCTRYSRNRDEIDPDGFPFSFMADVTSAKTQNIGHRYQETLTINLEVHSRDLTATALSALRRLVFKTIMADPGRGGNAAVTKVGGDAATNVPPGEWGPGVQGFAGTIEVFLPNVRLDT